ncbi:MAG: cupin domain-containing protein [Rhizomicrobium sp.]|nr:cupin domain-containing protein [Rhizomicrobium sp.]
MKRITALLVTALLASPALAGAPTVMMLSSSDQTIIGQTIVSPEHPTVNSSIVTFQSGDKTGVHKHPYPHYGYMLEGVLTIVNTETGKSFDLKAGEFLVEMLNTAHYGENRGTVPVRILIVDSVPAGVTNNSVAVAP